MKATLFALLPRNLIEFLSSKKSRLKRRQAQRRYEPLVASLFPGSSSHTVLAAFDDSAVFRVAIGDGSQTILKIASTTRAVERLASEMRALEELAGIGALDGWHDRISRVGDSGVHDGGTWFTQTALPGIATMRLGEAADVVVARAAAALRPVHDATSCSALADDDLLDRLVGARTATLARWRPSSTAEIAHLESSLRDRLADRPLTLSRLHGDYAPTNVLWDPDTRDVRGIVDWTFAVEPLPPEIDLAHFALALSARRSRSEYGAVVVRLLDGASSAETSTIRSAVAAGPNGFDPELGATMAWLEHVSFTLTKADDLRNNPIWLQNNVDQVIARLAAD